MILKVKKLGEADKLLIVLGKKSGRIEAIAKGASRLLSRKASSLDLLNIVNFSFHKGKSFDIVTEAELINDFEPLKLDLLSTSQIFYCLELLDRFLFLEDLESELIYELMLEFLSEYELNVQLRPQLILGFEIKLISLLGFGPNLEGCLECGEYHEADSLRIAASHGMAGYLCHKHFFNNDFSDRLVPDNVIKLQKFILQNSVSSIKSLSINEQLLKRLQSIQKSWIEGVLERDIKALALLNEVNTKNERRNATRT